MSRVTRLAWAAEHVVTRALERRLERRLRVRARRVGVDRNYLRGRSCHCPRTLPVHFVHSEGLREGCDVVVDYGSNVEHAARRQLPVDAIAHVGREIRRGDAIHVKTDLMDQFVELVLPSIAEPFVLVTGDSDASAVKTFAHLLDDARLQHWFAQNCDVDARHPRLTRVPIGLDNPMYTKLDKRLGFAVAMLLGRMPWDPSLRRNDIGDQVLLHRVKARRRRPVASRPPRALCTFHRNSKLLADVDAIVARAAAYGELLGEPHCHFVPRRLTQEACWAIHEEFAFEIAPSGRGLDTFRVWEALLLDTIPVVPASPLAPLYLDEDFPVLMVDSWRQVTGPALVAAQRDLAPRFTPAVAHRLTNDYWLAKIRRAQGRPA